MTFDGTVKVKRTIPLNQYTSAEWDASFYSKDDYMQFCNSVVELAGNYEENYIISSENRELCFRGVEHYTPERCLSNSERMALSYDCVKSFQHTQPGLMVLSLLRLSQESEKEARARGFADRNASIEFRRRKAIKVNQQDKRPLHSLLLTKSSQIQGPRNVSVSRAA